MNTNMKPKILGIVAVVAVYLLQIGIYSVRQPRIAIGNGRGDDGVTYGRMAEQFLAHHPVEGPAPFVYRIGGPWIASQYANVFSVSVDDAFQQVNGILMLLLLLVIYWIALDFCSPLAAAIATCFYSLPWWSYTRCVFFYPVMGSDVPWMIIMMMGLHQLVWWSDWPPRKSQIGIFASLCFLAPIMRETGIVLPFLFLCSRSWIRRHVSLEVVLGDPDHSPSPSTNRRTEAALSVLFVSLSILAIAITRTVATDTGKFTVGGKAYTFAGAVLESIGQNRLWHLVASVCLAYGGPLIALAFLYHRYLRLKLRQTPVLVIYGVAVLTLAYIGGVNTLRFLSWASPPALIVIAHLAQKFWNEPTGRAGLIVARSGLILGTLYYMLMIHPFSGYFTYYYAWMDWGGLQFSSIRCLRYTLPCLALIGLFVLFGRKWIRESIGRAQPANPPYPEPAAGSGPVI